MDSIKQQAKQALSEMKVMFWIRMALRVVAWVVLIFMIIYRIIKPVIDNDEIIFTSGDKQVFFWSGAVLLAIELIKKVYELVMSKFGTTK